MDQRERVRVGESSASSRDSQLDLSRFIVDLGASVLETLRVIDRAGSGLALVVTDGRRLAGVVTDGDVRRAIITGGKLDDPIRNYMSSDFRSVPVTASRTEVVELMEAWSVAHIPVIDDRGVLVGLHLRREILGFQDLPNWAVVMAGGRGSRLGTITSTIPKPMIPIAGRPILERIVLQLVDAGIRTVYLSVNYLAEVIERHFGDGSAFGCEIRYLRESRPLGTGGSLGLLSEIPKAPLLVMNGDLLTQTPIHMLLSYHAAGGQVATVALTHYYHEVPFGCVELEGDRIVAVREKPRLTRVVNTGIYVLDPSVVRTVERDKPLEMPDLIGHLLSTDNLVRGFVFEEDWLDIGRREDLEVARFGRIDDGSR